MRRAFSVLFTVLSVLACSSEVSGRVGASKADPFLLNPPVIAGVFNVVNQQTSVVAARALQTINPAVRNLILIGAGQSNMTNSPQAPPYTPTNGSAIDQFNIYDGAIYAGADPALGTSINNYPALGGGNPLLRIADSEIGVGNFDRVIIASVAIDGTAVSDWDPAQNGVLANRLPVLFARLAARGLVAGTNVTVIVLWGQGETDTTNGTTQSAYTTALNNVIAASRTAGFAGLWFVAVQTYNIGSTSTAVAAAQAAVVNHGANVWAGPNADSIIGTTCSGTCRPDNLHFGSLGMPVYASAWQTAMHASGAPF